MAAEAGGATELGRSHSFSQSLKSHLTRRFSKKHKRSKSAMSATATTTDSVNPNPILRVNNSNAYCRQFHRPVPSGSRPMRSSLLNAPPMTKVWLDDESDSDVSDNDDDDETKKMKPLREPKISLPTSLRRLGSNKKKQQSVDLNGSTAHQRTGSSLSHHRPSHSRSNSATSRLFNFLSQKPTPPPKISAPTNFVHHRHIDADYLRGSNNDKHLSRSLSLQQKPPVAPPAAIPEHGVQLQRSDSQSSPPTRQFNRRSHYQHRHGDSSSSGATTTTTTASTFSRPTSALSSSTSLNPSPLIRHKNDPRVLDKKSSVESFASWGAASSNADFLEQQKWLLNSTPDHSQHDAYAEHSLDSYTRYQKSPYSCYYSSSTTTIPQAKRKSTLLPSPSLPVTETEDVPVSEPPPVNLDSLSYGPPLTSIVAGHSNVYSFTSATHRRPQTNPPI